MILSVSFILAIRKTSVGSILVAWLASVPTSSMDKISFFFTISYPQSQATKKIFMVNLIFQENRFFFILFFVMYAFEFFFFFKAVPLWLRYGEKVQTFIPLAMWRKPFPHFHQHFSNTISTPFLLCISACMKKVTPPIFTTVFRHLSSVVSSSQLLPSYLSHE